MDVHPKKKFGQHFLVDPQIAERIVGSLTFHNNFKHILEIGPGTGILTEILFDSYPDNTVCMEVDRESIRYLHNRYPDKKGQILEVDFLKADILQIIPGKMGIIGNFPYNISSQILFKVFNHKHRIEEVVGMFQKEVAERITAGSGNKTYGILSVILGAYYDIEYLFTVEPEVFQPAPRVKSAVIRLQRNRLEELPCEEKNFLNIVKQGFQKRRKTLRNALKGLNLPVQITRDEIFDKRAEQLTVNDFIGLTSKIELQWTK